VAGEAIVVRVEGGFGGTDSGCTIDLATAEWLFRLELPRMFGNDLKAVSAALSAGEVVDLLEISDQEVEQLLSVIERARRQGEEPEGVEELARALRYEPDWE
jgi:hypothetical protein